MSWYTYRKVIILTCLSFFYILYFRKVNEKAEALTHKIFETTRVSQTQGRRKTHNDLQDHLNSVLVDIRLYDKGIQCVGDEDGRKILTTYTLKTICTEATNALFSYVAEENMLPLDTSKELTAQVIFTNFMSVYCPSSYFSLKHNEGYLLTFINLCSFNCIILLFSVNTY